MKRPDPSCEPEHMEVFFRLAKPYANHFKINKLRSINYA